MEDHLAVFVVIFAVAVFENRVFACDLNGVQRCAADLQSKSVGMQVAGISSMPTKRQLDTVCSLLGKFRECYRPKIAGCGNDAAFQLMFGLVGNTVDFLCEEGYNDIIKYETCWERKDVTDSMNACAKATSDAMTETRQHTHSSESQMAITFCSILKTAEDCMEIGVREKCGKEPGNLVRRMLSRIYRGLHDIMSCSELSSNGNTGSSFKMTSGIWLVTGTVGLLFSRFHL
ncbi:hypothetical protein ScPMuIL_007222 [Solemya velum]